MTSVEDRYRRHAAQIAKLEAFLQHCAAPDKWFAMRLLPPSQLEQMRKEAEEELRSLHEYCREGPVKPAKTEPPDPKDAREAALDELAMLFAEAARKQIRREREA